MRKSCTAALFLLILSATSAGAADILSDALKLANAAPWGAKQDAVKRKMPNAPVMGNKAIMMAPARLGGRDATVNYLFDKDGGLFNVAWYVVTPVDDFEAANALNRDLENALRAQYGEPIHTFSDGDQAEAEKIKAIPPQDRASMEKFMEYMQSGGPGKGKKDAGAGGPDLLSLMPHVFYSKLLFWDGGKVWVYTNFICSTDGTCYQHLQFVSKERTKKDGYAPQFQTFNQSALDRDQDMVTAVHKSWAAKGAKR